MKVYQRISMLAAASLCILVPLKAQELIWQETFESDGEGSRYDTFGTNGAYNLDEFVDNGINTSQLGPVFFARTVEGRPSIVGVDGPTPARRIHLVWHNSIASENVTEDFLTHFDHLITWLTEGRSTGTILVGSGVHEVMLDRLEANGMTIVEDFGEPIDDPDFADAFILGDGNTPNCNRFQRLAMPGLVYNSGGGDGCALGPESPTITLELPNVSITAPEHSASGDQTGTFRFLIGENNLQGLGAELPENSTVVAAYVEIVPASVGNLVEADQLFDGTTPNTGVVKGNADAADLVNESNPGNGVIGFPFDLDSPLAGASDGGFAVRATGRLEVDRADTYTLALGAADGGRLRIDLDGNGVDAADEVLTLDRRGGFQYSNNADIDFAAGAFDFEWVSFNAVGEFGAEIAIALDAGGDVSGIDGDNWDVLSTSSANVKLSGQIATETFAPDLPPQEVTTPFSVAFEGPDDGGLLFGGGPLRGFEGEHFFGFAGTDDFPDQNGDFSGVKIIEWTEPIDVTGKEDLRLTLSMAGTFLDWDSADPGANLLGDAADFFRVEIDPNNTDEWQALLYFTAPSGDEKFFDDRRSNPANPTRLSLTFQDVTYSIPDGGSQMKIRVKGYSTFWNEIIGWDNMRITAGGAPPTPTVAEITSISVSDNMITIEGSGNLAASATASGSAADYADTGIDLPATVAVSAEGNQFFIAK